MDCLQREELKTLAQSTNIAHAKLKVSCLLSVSYIFVRIFQRKDLQSSLLLQSSNQTVLPFAAIKKPNTAAVGKSDTNAPFDALGTRKTVKSEHLRRQILLLTCAWKRLKMLVLTRSSEVYPYRRLREDVIQQVESCIP